MSRLTILAEIMGIKYKVAQIITDEKAILHKKNALKKDIQSMVTWITKTKDEVGTLRATLDGINLEKHKARLLKLNPGQPEKIAEMIDNAQAAKIFIKKFVDGIEELEGLSIEVDMPLYEIRKKIIQINKLIEKYCVVQNGKLAIPGIKDLLIVLDSVAKFKFKETAKNAILTVIVNIKGLLKQCFNNLKDLEELSPHDFIEKIDEGWTKTVVEPEDIDRLKKAPQATFEDHNTWRQKFVTYYGDYVDIKSLAELSDLINMNPDIEALAKKVYDSFERGHIPRLGNALYEEVKILKEEMDKARTNNLELSKEKSRSPILTPALNAPEDESLQVMRTAPETKELADRFEDILRRNKIDFEGGGGTEGAI